jgi:hypothetical protein
VICKVPVIELCGSRTGLDKRIDDLNAINATWLQIFGEQNDAGRLFGSSKH